MTDVLAQWDNPRPPSSPEEPVRVVELTLYVQARLDDATLIDKVHRILTGGTVRRGPPGGEVVELEVSRFPRAFRGLTVEAIYDDEEGDEDV